MSRISFAAKSEPQAPQLPANFSIANARLPANYENAKKALADCASLDECIDWADKAAALASYAKQADDKSLLDYATRVKGRAIRRAGELLKQVEPGQGARDGKREVGAHPPLRGDVAARAGLSPHQAKQALRVASVPPEEFDRQVEGPNPPSVTALAEQGKKAVTAPKRGKPDWMPETRPEGFKAATEVIGTVENFADFCSKNDALTVAAAVMDHEVGALRGHVATIDGWLDRFVVNLKG